jgi:hypothetical protein
MSLQQFESVEAQAPDRPARLPDPDALPRRFLHMAALRGLGYSLRAIGRNYGVSPQAVSVMLTRHKKLLRAARSGTGMESLSPRAVNVLGRLRISGRTEAIADVYAAAPEHPALFLQTAGLTPDFRQAVEKRVAGPLSWWH